MGHKCVRFTTKQPTNQQNVVLFTGICCAYLFHNPFQFCSDRQLHQHRGGWGGGAIKRTHQRMALYVPRPATRNNNVYTHTHSLQLNTIENITCFAGSRAHAATEHVVRARARARAGMRIRRNVAASAVRF